MNQAQDAIKIIESVVDSKLDDSGLRDYIINAICKTDGMMIKEIHCDEYFCPNCGSENNCDEYYIGDRYCPQCGQKLIVPGNEEEY